MERLGIAPAARDHREDRQVQRLGDRPQVAGMLAQAARRAGDRGRRASPRPPRARRRPPPGRTGRGRPPRASARRRGAGPAGRSPARPPPWPSGRRASGNAGLASSDGSTRPASPGTPPRAPARSRWSPGPVAGAGHLRLAVSRDGARWHSSGPKRPGDRAHLGSARFDASRHDGAGIPPIPPPASSPVPTETRPGRRRRHPPALASLRGARPETRLPRRGAGINALLRRTAMDLRNDARGSTRSSLIVLPQSNTQSVAT